MKNILTRNQTIPGVAQNSYLYSCKVLDRLNIWLALKNVLKHENGTFLDQLIGRYSDWTVNYLMHGAIKRLPFVN